MKKVSVMFSLLFCQSAMAGDDFVQSGIDWFRSLLAEDAKVELDKSAIDFRGCRHLDYDLTFTRPINRTLSMSAGINYAEGKIEWGVYQQKIQTQSLFVEPSVALSEQLNVSVSLAYQDRPRFTADALGALYLPQSYSVGFKSTVIPINEQHSWEFAVTQQRWDNHNHSVFADHSEDNRVSLEYRLSF